MSTDVYGYQLDEVSGKQIQVVYGRARADSAFPFRQAFTGDGVTTDFDLEADPVSILMARVTINGLVQDPTVDYELVNSATADSGKALRFTVAPVNGVFIRIYAFKPVRVGTAVVDADLIAIDQGGTLQQFIDALDVPTSDTVTFTPTEDNAETTVQAAIVSVDDRVNAEIIVRGMADTALQANIDAESTARQNITITAGSGLTGGGDLSANRTVSADFASEAEALAGSSLTKIMSPGRVAAAVPTATTLQIRGLTGTGVVKAGELGTAVVPTTPSGAGTWTPDWTSFLTATWVLTDNRTLANPTAVVVGTTRIVVVKGSDATNRTLSWGTNYKGFLPSGPVNSSQFLMLSLYAASATEIVVSSVVWP